MLHNRQKDPVERVQRGYNGFLAIKMDRKNEIEHFKDDIKVSKNRYLSKNALFVYYWVRDHSCRYVCPKLGMHL